MGSWYAVKNGVGYTFAAVAENVQADEREKFKCFWCCCHAFRIHIAKIPPFFKNQIVYSTNMVN
jgi:hypothetical protein